MSLFEKLHKTSEVAGQGLTAKEFYLENNVNGYEEKQKMLNYIHGLNRKEMEELELFFDYLKEGKQLNSLPIVKKDRAGKTYIWCIFKMPNAKLEIKVITPPSIAQFIRDYQGGKVKVEFTLEELYNEAQSASTDNAA